MILHKGVKILLNGVRTSVDVEAHSRNGTKSPRLYIVVLRNKRLAPIAWDKYGIVLDITSYFGLIYSIESIRELVFRHNPFLSLVPKEDTWTGHHFVVPLAFGSKEDK